ncbi:M1 family peptidase [Flagellimonas allohymeniacidonis]|uniref:Aminopeptidase N n=2 Tax=Flagellimonas allohymeniacidonis TaxID=2517819 RepID=A0A4Q8QNE0_9FLAO|nr:M1 family peptidase [Allomuricauda hymeniacidonis]
MRLSPIFLVFLTSHLVFSQIQDNVDFIHGDISIFVDAESKKIVGTVEYHFQVLKDVDSIFLDAKNMNFNKVLLDGEPLQIGKTPKYLILDKKFRKAKEHRLTLSYNCTPKQTVYFLGWDATHTASKQIWTQGQGKYTSHWLPSFDDMNEKIEFDLKITFNQDYQVLANGKLNQVLEKDGLKTWHFDMQSPMSSYLLAFAIGSFDKKELSSTSGVPIELYYEPKDSLKVEPTYRYTREIFDYLEKEIGIPYPWQNYKQVPVQDFLYAGMENTGATIFSNTFVIDSIAFKDKNYVNVNAHEMAHQWFGNLVTEQSGNHHWLHEGFATFYAYLAEKQLFGDDYFYWRLWETATSLSNLSGDGNGEALTDPGAGSLTFYEKGAWALVILRDKVGHENFKQAIENYLNKFAYQNVTISDFMWEVRKASGMKLLDFENSWLQESAFPLETAKDFLRTKNSSLKTYFEIQAKAEEDEISTLEWLTAQWKDWDSDFLKSSLLYDFGNQLPVDLLDSILQTEGIKVRQALAMNVERVSPELKESFEILLADESYLTQEAALFRLWTDFPKNQVEYLDQTKDIEGMPNKNVRLLWLTLALVTPGYADALKPEFFQELSNYTHPKYHFETRLLAFQYLKNLNAFSDNTLKNLINACNHHVWYFKKSSRKLLKEFLKGEESDARLKGIYQSLNPEEKSYLDKTLGK